MRRPVLPPRVLVAIVAVLCAAGLVLTRLGHDQRTAADAALLNASFRAITGARALDTIAVTGGAPTPDATAARDLARQIRQNARTPAEAEAVDAISRCLAGSGCPGGLEASVNRARGAYERALAAQWSRAESERVVSARMDDVGLLLAAASALVAALGLFGVFGPSPYRTTFTQIRRSIPGTGLEGVLKKRLEDLYSARMRAWENDRFAAYGEVAAGLSHGLKTPLASIRAAAQVALAKLGHDHPAATHLDDVIAEVDALVDQVKRFLNATGSGEPVPARIAPAKLLEAVDRDYAGAAAMRGVKWAVSIAQDAHEISVDPALLEMALRNLVENALAATPRDKGVTLAVKNTSPPDRAGLNNDRPVGTRWVEITVEDQGGGIPENVILGERVQSDKPDGSGLGIAITRRIVARHGGTVLFDASAEGSSVRLVLPAAAEAGGGAAA